MIQLKCKKLSNDATIPTKSNISDAGWDLYASADIQLEPLKVTKVSTNIAMVFPENVWGQIEGRSGLASKGIFPVGGIVDQSYTGHVMVVLMNSTSLPYHISKGDRIAQLVLRSQIQSTIDEIEELPNSERGSNGFGSSGK